MGVTRLNDDQLSSRMERTGKCWIGDGGAVGRDAAAIIGNEEDELVKMVEFAVY